MINLNVYEFCKNCSYFEPKTSVIDNDGITESGDTIFEITCEHKLSCMYAYSEGIKDGIAEASKYMVKDGKTNE